MMYFLLFLVSSLLLLVITGFLFLKTFKNPLLVWISVIFLTLLMGLLSLGSYLAFNAFFWMICIVESFILVLLSILFLIINLIRFFIAKISNDKEKYFSIGLRIATSIFVIATFIGGLLLAQRAQKRAEDFSMKIAEKIQIECDQNGYCPDNVENFTNCPNCEFHFTIMGRSWHATYSTSDNRSTFFLNVGDISPFGNTFSFSGGVGRSLFKGYSGI